MAHRSRWIFLVALSVSVAAIADQPKEYATTARTGSFVIKPTYEQANDFSEGLAAVKIGDGWGFIDTTGKLAIDAHLNPGQGGFNSHFSDGLCAVNFFPGGQGAKWGFIDRTGAVAINPQFDGDFFRPPFFSEGLAAVHLGYNQYGYIDKTGKVVIEPQFSEALWFSEGLAAVRTQDWKWGYIDKAGKFAIAPTLKVAGSFSEGLASATPEDKDGFIDRSGAFVVEPTFYSLSALSDGLAQVQIKQFSHIDKSGNAVADPTMDDKTSPKYGYADRTGKIVIAPQFESTMTNSLMGRFSEGLAPVEFGKQSQEPGKWDASGKIGFIDKTGRMVIAPKFDGTWGFSEGLAPVQAGDKWGYIDKTGQMVISAKFDSAGVFSDGLARVSIGGKNGYIAR